LSKLLGIFPEDVKIVDLISVKDLCPGGVPGRLTIWSETAIQKVGDKFV